MIWNHCLVIAVVIFVGMIVTSVVLKLFRKKWAAEDLIAACRNEDTLWANAPGKGRRLELLSIPNMLFVATVISSYILTLPIMDAIGCGVLEGVLITIQHMLQVFSLDGDFTALREMVGCTTELGTQIYCGFAAFLYALAPVLTISVVLSFFKNLTAYFRLYWHRMRNLYVFSELNEKSLVLAQSCILHELNGTADAETGTKKKPRTAQIVFTDVFESNDEHFYELHQRAEKLGALCFKKDILSLDYRFHSKKSRLTFFIIGEDESENIQHTLRLVELYGAYQNARLYSFTTSTESALLIGSVMSRDLEMKVRRINQTQSLIYNYLYQHNIFECAVQQPDGEKLLSVAIIGMGRYGTEFLKAITWAGQMPGYRLEIHVFDQDPEAEEKFTSMCPELMQMNCKQIDGEAQYSITFHHKPNGQGINVRSIAFDDIITKIGNISLAFIALGKDEDDIEISIKLRMLFKRCKPDRKPVIESVIYEDTKASTVQRYSLNDYKGNDFGIHFINELRETYTYEVIVGSKLEEEAKRRHLKWSTKESRAEDTLKFYKYEYFYRSSVARVIRQKFRKEVGLPGTEKEAAQRTLQERTGIQRAEHIGWNAYMRTEGYCYGKRDDQAKLHHDLVPFEKLPSEERKKIVD